MITLLIFSILWMPYLVKRLLSAAQRTRTATKNASPQVPPKPPYAVSGTGSQDGQTWSTLDDRQLTRLLVDSAPPTTSEQDSV